MLQAAEERKRAALWTIGRGSRGLLGFHVNGTSFLVAGTTVASGGNMVHILRSDEVANSFTPIGVHSTDAEVWSMELVVANKDSVDLVAVTRRKRESSVETWSLPLVDAWRTEDSRPSAGTGIDSVPSPIQRKSYVDLEGKGIKIKRQGRDGRKYLIVADSVAAVVDVSETLDIKLWRSWDCDVLCGKSIKGTHVDGGWTTDTLVFVASHDTIGIFDSTTGNLEVKLTPSAMIQKPVDSEEIWIPPFISKISSACFDGEHFLYIGGEDGSVRAFDVRTSAEIAELSESEQQQWVSVGASEASDDSDTKMTRMRWEVLKAHSQWVSVLCPTHHGGVLSGGVDGVVRCWAQDGSPSGTFPQHVDTVTGAVVAAQSFVTISYDGRIALNQVPMGA